MIDSVLQEWVQSLPYRMQALLMTSVRGPDGMSKNCNAKPLIRFFRGAIMLPADRNYRDTSGNTDNFMWLDYTSFNDYVIDFFSDHDQYPHHFIMHLIHAGQVIGYYHPKDEIRIKWYGFYAMACDSLHMNVETEAQISNRLK